MSGSGLGWSIVNQKLCLRSLSELDSKVLPVAGGAPFFSPDGRWVGFFGGTPENVQVRKLGLDGGAPLTVCKVVNGAFAGGTWAANDTIHLVLAIPGGLMRVAAVGGEPQVAAKIDSARGERFYKYPCALPGAKAVLFTISTADAETFDDAHIVVLDVETGQRKTLV
jgi:eukaryotic-like serine/threonine-protein kinase